MCHLVFNDLTGFGVGDISVYFYFAYLFLFLPCGTFFRVCAVLGRLTVCAFLGSSARHAFVVRLGTGSAASGFVTVVFSVSETLASVTAEWTRDERFDVKPEIAAGQLCWEARAVKGDDEEAGVFMLSVSECSDAADVSDAFKTHSFQQVFLGHEFKFGSEDGAFDMVE